MKAIEIKYLPPTNTKCSRMKAFTEGGNSITVPFDYELDIEELEDYVARLLIKKMAWDVVITGRGQLPNGNCVITLGRTK